MLTSGVSAATQCSRQCISCCIVLQQPVQQLLHCVATGSAPAATLVQSKLQHCSFFFALVWQLVADCISCHTSAYKSCIVLQPKLHQCGSYCNTVQLFFALVWQLVADCTSCHTSAYKSCTVLQPKLHQCGSCCNTVQQLLHWLLQHNLQHREPNV